MTPKRCLSLSWNVIAKEKMKSVLKKLYKRSYIKIG